MEETASKCDEVMVGQCTFLHLRVQSSVINCVCSGEFQCKKIYCTFFPSFLFPTFVKRKASASLFLQEFFQKFTLECTHSNVLDYGNHDIVTNRLMHMQVHCLFIV